VTARVDVGDGQYQLRQITWRLTVKAAVNQNAQLVSDALRYLQPMQIMQKWYHVVIFASSTGAALRLAATFVADCTRARSHCGRLARVTFQWSTFDSINEVTSVASTG